jgi:leader peptidase (prepilin peptidase)/N-methyltransferase
VLEVAVAVTAAALIVSGLRGLSLLAYAWWAAVGLVLAFVDLAVQRLPARLSYIAAGGILVVLLGHALVTHAWHPWARSIIGALVTVVALALCALAMPRLVHWGDVRYAFAVGAAAAWPGWLSLYTTAFLATLSAATVGVGLILAGRARLTTHIPQGPFWFAGTIFTLALLRV